MGYFGSGGAGGEGAWTVTCPHGVNYPGGKRARDFCPECLRAATEDEAAKQAAYEEAEAARLAAWEALPLLVEVYPEGRVQTYDGEGRRDKVVLVAEYRAGARVDKDGGVWPNHHMAWDRVVLESR